jgi:uncharacterized protein YndB with AHSA1/START domain
MSGAPQGKNEQLIEAPAASVWSIVEDSSALANWVPAVERVVSHEQREAPGTVRRCDVELGGKRGYIIERCVEAIPERRVSHAVEDDSLGLTRLFAEYSFSLDLAPRGPQRTLVTCETFYNPRGPLSRMLNAVVMRRRFDAVRRQILLGLKELAEGRSETMPETEATAAGSRPADSRETAPRPAA